MRDGRTSIAAEPPRAPSFCTGSLGASADNDLPAMIRSLGSRGRVHFMHCRNVRRTGERQFHETPHPSSFGSVDMLAVMRALSAIDTAVWDLNARTVKLPLFQYLGAMVEDRVPAYASGGYYLPGKTPQKLGEELAGYVKDGFKAVKMKTGRLSPREEEDRIRAAREAIGPDVLLMLDANNAIVTDANGNPVNAANLPVAA